MAYSCFGILFIHTNIYMPNLHIRSLALCIFRRKHEILVAEGFDSRKKETFYRPLGGGIEFGEYSWDAVRREIREEIGEEIKNLSFLGTTENIFEYEGTPGHEVIFVFEGEFTRTQVYQQQEIVGIEDDGTDIKVLWKSMEAFEKGKLILYPDGLTEMLSSLPVM